MNYSLHNFETGLKDLGISLNEKQVSQFITFYEMLIEKNKVMNLTAITDWEEVVHKHFLDSLTLVKVLDLKNMVSIIDIGTGAGFPGIPLKIAFPHIKITMADSLNKRIRFIQEVIEKCGFKSVEAVHGRAEDLARKSKYREQFDVCVSRAVANLSSLSEYCLPFVQVGGCFISYKSGEIEDELAGAKKAIEVLGGEKMKIEKFQLPDTDISRSLIVIEKRKLCSKKYPRKAGMPTSNPL